MTEAEAWQAGRGVWAMNLTKAAGERFALIVGEGRVRAIGEITGTTVHDGRVALTGNVVGAGHPLHDAYVDRPDPLANDSNNSITYGDLPEEAPFRNRPCGCGCGLIGDRDFAAGHELKAIQARIREHFGGSALDFIRWIDANAATRDDRYTKADVSRGTVAD